MRYIVAERAVETGSLPATLLNVVLRFVQVAEVSEKA
jgi:hypothetical protein